MFNALYNASRNEFFFKFLYEITEEERYLNENGIVDT